MAVKVPARRYGGKVHLAKWILSHFPEHTTYIEPFCGSAAVFFAKPPSKAEILNDLDNRILKAFEMIRSRPKEMAALLWATPYAQKNWREIGTRSEIEEAGLYLASSQQFYGAATNTSTFSMDVGYANKNKAQVWADWFQRILPAAARLKHAQLLNEDAVKVIERFKKRKDALYYVDPPYKGHENEYPYKVDYERMVSALKGVAGKVIVSEYTEASHYYKGWRTVRKECIGRVRTGAHKMKSKSNVEVLYMNFKEAESLPNTQEHDGE